MKALSPNFPKALHDGTFKGALQGVWKIKNDEIY